MGVNDPRGGPSVTQSPQSTKRYDGYASFDYLEPGIDYEVFDLVDEPNAFEPYQVPVTESEADRIARLVTETTTVAAHEHPHLHPKDMEDVIEYVKAGRIHTGYEWLAETHLDCVIDALLHGIEMIETKRGWKWDDVISDIGMRLADVGHSEYALVGRSIADIERAHEEDKLAIVFAIESGQVIENELDRLDILYGLGVRMSGFTYNDSTMLGTGGQEAADCGLTALGHAAVDRMNKLGMAIGLSHESEETILDICDASADPVILSHTGARGVWDIKRQEPDEVLKAVADTGGVLAVEAAPNSTRSEAHPEHSIESVMEHFEYIEDLVGIDHVTFATDTIYGDHAALMDTISEMVAPADLFFEKGGTEGTEHVQPVDYVRGMENPTEAWQNIPRWLVKNGYSDEEVSKVLGGNTLRVLDAIWE